MHEHFYAAESKLLFHKNKKIIIRLREQKGELKKNIVATTW